MAQLKHHPQLILLWVARNYMNDAEFKAMLDALGQGFKTDGKFLRIVLKHFDKERIKTNRIVPQDDFIYNYLEYECKGTKLPQTALIARYEKEIAIPAEGAFKDLMKYVS
jgi:hypothetical protein